MFYLKVLSVFLAFCLLFCPMVTAEEVETLQPEPVYDRLYPYYVELCALSQIAPIGHDKGGSAGHAVLYLKGACRDKDAAYPTIKMCDPKRANLKSPDTGVGISVNKIFQNVNWVATPTKKLFFRGALPERKVLTKKEFEKAIDKAVKLGVFDGIKVHEQYLKDKPEDMPLEEFIANESIGTDFALTFGRSVFCVRLPITEAMLGKMVDYLNGLNEEYATDKAGYNWSGYHDNCAHTVHNALASAQVWEHKTINTFRLLQLFNLAIPANEFIDLAMLVKHYPVEDIRRIYDDDFYRKSLIENDWVPAEAGSLLDVRSVHKKNELYNTKFNIFILQRPFARDKGDKIRDMLEEPRFTSLKDNLLYFKNRYEKILEDKPEAFKKGKKGSYQKFKKEYYNYIEDELEIVNKNLKRV